MVYQPLRTLRNAAAATPEQQQQEQGEPTKGRFSVFYFVLIYIYTQSLLQHFPQPQHLVSDTYQPVSDKAHPSEGNSFESSLRSLRHCVTANMNRRGSAFRRRRASSAASNSTVSSYGAPSVGARFDDITPIRNGTRAGANAASGTPGTPSTPSSAATTATGAGAGASLNNLKKKTLVLDLDETLIHSSPQGSYRAHHRIEVVIDKVACLYYVYKRPHVDYFLRKVCEWYKYADPVIDLLDSQGKYISARYFRESCVPHDSSYAKDLSAIDPDLSQIVLVDNSPLSYFINPTNGIPIQPWVNSDPKDEACWIFCPCWTHSGLPTMCALSCPCDWYDPMFAMNFIFHTSLN
ncbi:HAD-like domain-containing protein [Kickxella alabastrina]|uniref:HAD-like domain-containing protein n=1 Tax=Kickxella alabastrina TaxID=61397 RepID=UPI002220EAF7|nr:HAD-like domain-containing protein [Kickxella alabastrina]KAI7832038.1 HAD-like domain-containing protein [Kickxella alabastrina]